MPTMIRNVTEPVPKFVPKFPEPPPPEGGYGCPRCGSPHTSEMDAGPRLGLLTLLETTQCNACGFTFRARSGKSVVPTMVAIMLAVVVIPFGLFMLYYVLAAR